jgi:hypothetical protein
MTCLQIFPRHLAICALAALALAMGFARMAPADARPLFDGNWSVLIVTEQGECDRAYRYPLRIAGGTVSNGGDIPLDISGKVAGNGAITVRVTHGDKSASGRGRLSGTTGAGKWNAGSCTGTWSAERRG